MQGLAAFGLSLSADVPVPGAWGQGATVGGPSLDIKLVGAQAVLEAWSGVASIGWEAVIDGAPFIVERGMSGDHLFIHGAHPVEGDAHAGGHGGSFHHLSADASLLRCAPSDPTGTAWWRVVLDSVLFTVALLQGYEALHAGAVATKDGALAITAPSGGGKSTLLAALLQRGLPLMADDVLVLRAMGADAPIAYPAPPLMTVPVESLKRIAALAPAGAISFLGPERWIAVPVHPKPLALKAMVVLDRREGLATSLTRIETPLALLLGTLMSYPVSVERQRARFELAAAMASEVELWRLSAEPHCDPDVLAQTLLEGLGSRLTVSGKRCI